MYKETLEEFGQSIVRLWLAEDDSKIGAAGHVDANKATGRVRVNMVMGSYRDVGRTRAIANLILEACVEAGNND